MDENVIIRQNPTYNLTIYVGRKRRRDGHIHPLQTVREVCQEFCDCRGLCVTITETEYIYTQSNEPGAAIGFINYARFDSDPGRYKNLAIELAKLLKAKLDQLGVSVVLPDTTIWIADPEVTVEREGMPKRKQP